MSNILNVQSVTENRYQLDVPDIYEYPATKNIRILQATPGASEIRSITPQRTGATDISYETTMSKEQFLSTNLLVQMKIPFILTLKTWPQASGSNVVMDKTNFMEYALNDGDCLALSELAMLNGLDSYQLRLNDSFSEQVNDISKLSAITSAYWDAKNVNKFLQASIPDRYQEIADYSKKSVTFIDEFLREAAISISPDNEFDPWSSKIPHDYNSRAPVWSYIDSNASTRTVRVTCDFWTYIPFSLGTLPNTESALAGVNKLSLSLRLASNFGDKVFLRKNDYITSVQQDLSDVTGTNMMSRLVCKIYTAPEYIRETMIDSKTHLMKPYTISLPIIEFSEFLSQNCTAKGSQSFVKDGISLASIPRSIYISLNKDDAVNKLDETVSFGLIKNLSVSINSSITNFADIMSLKALVESNGYSQLDVVGALMKGYPIKLDLSKDLTLPNGVCVGAAGNFILSISGTFVNQGSVDHTYKLCVTTVYEGELQFSDERFSKSAGVFVPSHLLSDKYFMRDLYSENMEHLTVLGGGKFTDAMKWLGKNALKLAKNAWENRDAIAKTVGDVMAVAKTVRGGKLAMSNVSGGGTVTLGAGSSVRSTVFK